MHLDFLPASLQSVADCVEGLTPSSRKALVLHCRALQPCAPHPSTADQFLAQTSSPLHTLLLNSYRPAEREDLRSLFDQLLVSPVTASLLINLCRELPYPQETILELGNSSITKEYLVHASVRRNATIDWLPMFKGLPYAIHPFIPVRGGVNAAVSRTLDRFFQKLARDVRIFTLPPFSKKRPSSSAFPDLIAGEYGHVPCGDDYVIGHLESAFHHRKRRVTGPSQGKLKWTPADLKPRMYYALGGDHFGSAETRDLLLDLQQQFPFIANKTRVDPSRLNIGPHTCCLAYDFSTFTSNLSEVQNFIEQLAEYADLRKATVLRVDPTYGITRSPLGDLFRELASYHDHPEYTLPFDETGHAYEAAQAGFLGTYSNIVVSTILHGLFVYAMRGDPDSFNVAGDDGIILLSPDEVDETFSQLTVLGELAREKVWTLDRGSGPIVTLKRPLYFLVHEYEEGEIEERLVLQDIPSFPTLSFLMPRNPAFTFFNVKYDVEDPQTYLVPLIRSITTFLRDLSRIEISPLDIEVVGTYLRHVYSRLQLPEVGNLRYQKGRVSVLIPPIQADCWVGLDPIENAIARLTGPRLFITERFSELPFESSMYELDQFECNMNSYLRYLVNMGYFSYEKQSEVHIFESELASKSFLHRYLNTSYCSQDVKLKATYLFTRLREVPDSMRFVSGAGSFALDGLRGNVLHIFDL